MVIGRLDTGHDTAGVSPAVGGLQLPLYSNRSQYLREQRLLLDQGTEAFHQRAQQDLRHGRDQVVEHASQTEQ